MCPLSSGSVEACRLVDFLLKTGDCVLMLSTSNGNGTLGKVFDMNKVLRRTHTLDMSEVIIQSVVMLDSFTALSLSDTRLNVWNVETGSCEMDCRYYLPSAPLQAWAVPFPDGLVLVQCCSVGPSNPFFLVRVTRTSEWECTVGPFRMPMPISGRVSLRQSCVHAPTGRIFLAHNSAIVECRLREEATHVWKQIMEPTRLKHLVARPDGAVLALTWRSEVRLIRPSLRREDILLTLNALSNRATCVADVGNNCFVVGVDNGDLHLWSANIPCLPWLCCDFERPVRTFRGHSDEVRCVVFHKPSERLVSASRDTTLRVWNVDTGECIHVLRGHVKSVEYIASFGPSFVVSRGKDSSIRIWNVCTGKCVQVVRDNASLASCFHNFVHVVGTQRLVFQDLLYMTVWERHFRPIRDHLLRWRRATTNAMKRFRAVSKSRAVQYRLATVHQPPWDTGPL